MTDFAMTGIPVTSSAMLRGEQVVVSRISEQVQSDAALMLRLKNIGIQPGREVTLAASDNGVRVTGADRVGDLGAELPAEIADACLRHPAVTAAGEPDMGSLGDAALPSMTASDVLEQMATGVVVTDQKLALLYANAFAVSLFGFPDDSAHLIGRSLASLGLEQGDAAIVTAHGRPCAARLAVGRHARQPCDWTDPECSYGRTRPRCAPRPARSPA